jgi:uncharacterized protein YndB with AHSA1/START domain
VTDRILITRVFEAPRERVWREWTQPERFADWFGGADSEVPLSSVRTDVRAGGAWRLTMRTSGGEIFSHGDYREVVEREWIRLHAERRAAGRGVVRGRDRRVGRRRRRPDRRAVRAARLAVAGPARRGRSRFFDRIAERLAAGRLITPPRAFESGRCRITQNA